VKNYGVKLDGNKKTYDDIFFEKNLTGFRDSQSCGNPESILSIAFIAKISLIYITKITNHIPVVKTSYIKLPTL